MWLGSAYRLSRAGKPADQEVGKLPRMLLFDRSITLTLESADQFHKSLPLSRLLEKFLQARRAVTVVCGSCCWWSRCCKHAAANTQLQAATMCTLVDGRCIPGYVCSLQELRILQGCCKKGTPSSGLFPQRGMCSACWRCHLQPVLAELHGLCKQV